MADSFLLPKNSRFKWTKGDVLQNAPCVPRDREKKTVAESATLNLVSRSRNRVWRPAAGLNSVAHSGTLVAKEKPSVHSNASRDKSPKQPRSAKSGKFHSNRVWFPKPVHREDKLAAPVYGTHVGKSDVLEVGNSKSLVGSGSTENKSQNVSACDSRSQSAIRSQNQDVVKSRTTFHKNRVWRPQCQTQSTVGTFENKLSPTPPTLKGSAQVKMRTRRKHKNLVWKPQTVVSETPLSVPSVTVTMEMQKMAALTNSKGKRIQSSTPSVSQSLSGQPRWSGGNKYRWRRRRSSSLSNSKEGYMWKSPTSSQNLLVHSPYHSLWLERGKYRRSAYPKPARLNRRKMPNLKWTRDSGTGSKVPTQNHSMHVTQRRTSSYHYSYWSQPKHNVPSEVSSSRLSRWPSSSSSSSSSRFHWFSSPFLRRMSSTHKQPLLWTRAKPSSSFPSAVVREHRRTKKCQRNRVWMPSSSRVFRRVEGAVSPSVKDASRSPSLMESTSPYSHGPSAKRLMAKRAVQRSKAYFWSIKQKQLCTYYCRFGKCTRENCPYIHDNDKVKICPQFLLGVCEKKGDECILSHKIDKNKMPVCLFFLRGVCGRGDCPYLHVNLGREAEVCKEFVQGHCSQGQECTKLHAYYCPEYTIYGACGRGPSCPLRHKKQARHAVFQASKSAPQQQASTKAPKAFKRNKTTEVVSADGSTSGCVGVHTGVDSKEVGAQSDQMITLRPLDLKETPDYIPL